MSKFDLAGQYFEHVAEYSVAACQECRYAVWPDQIEGHLQRQHKVGYKEAEAVGQQVRSWAGLVQYSSELEIPRSVQTPVPQLALYEDGMLCDLGVGNCQQVFRSSKSLKNHWRKDHQGWSAGERRGRPSRTRAQGLQARTQQGYRRVYCQRLFGSRHGSQYFEVQAPSQEGEGPSIVPVDGEAAWARVGAEMARAWERVEKQAASTIQAGERDEVNPWVERTQWLTQMAMWSQPGLRYSWGPDVRVHRRSFRHAPSRSSFTQGIGPVRFPRSY